MDDWIKNGKVVVEGGAISDDGSFTPRLCVIGGGTIQIVSILENASYRCTTAADSLILHRVSSWPNRPVSAISTISDFPSCSILCLHFTPLHLQAPLTAPFVHQDTPH